MGRPMAERLIAAGYDVVGYDVRPKSEFGPFAEHMTDQATDFRACDVVISVVRDARQTRICSQQSANHPVSWSFHQHCRRVSSGTAEPNCRTVRR